MMQNQPLEPGRQTVFHSYHRFRDWQLRFQPLVRVLAIGKKTAHIEARRYDGRTKRMFVKRDRLGNGV